MSSELLGLRAQRASERRLFPAGRRRPQACTAQAPRSQGADDALRRGEVKPEHRRSGAEGAAEHCDEGARAVVAEVEGDRRHRLAGGQPLECRQQPPALPPAPEGQAGLVAEQPRQGAVAGADRPAPGLQVAVVGGRRDQGLGHRRRPAVARQRQVERRRRQVGEFVGQHRHQPRLRPRLGIVLGQPHHPGDQLADQGRHPHHPTARTDRNPGISPQIQGPHRDRPGRPDLVHHPRRHPHGIARRHHPGAVVGADRHHPLLAMHQLGAVVGMPAGAVAGGVVDGIADDRLGPALAGLDGRVTAAQGLSGFQHRLALYRRTETIGWTIISPSRGRSPCVSTHASCS